MRQVRTERERERGRERERERQRQRQRETHTDLNTKNGIYSKIRKILLVGSENL